jgi:diacylglycerol kinase (ATP)
MTIRVVCNPSAGCRAAQRRAAAFRQRWSRRAEFVTPSTGGETYACAREAIERGCDMLGAAGGDGTVHHVANALLDSGRAGDVTLAVIPVGTANDYASSVAKQFGETALDDPSAAVVDVGHASHAISGKGQYFVESLGLGVSADVAAEARGLLQLTGRVRYGLAALRIIRTGLVPRPFCIQIDGVDRGEEPTLLFSLLLGRREGNMVLAPAASLNDGLFSSVWVSRVSALEALRLLPQLLWSGVPRRHPAIHQGVCRQVHVASGEPFAVHTDGEVFFEAAPGEVGLDVRVVPGALRVKVCRFDRGPVRDR